MLPMRHRAQRPFRSRTCILAAGLVLLGLVSCNESSNDLAPSDDLARFVGTWLYVDQTREAPFRDFEAMTVHADGKVDVLWVETATGRLALCSKCSGDVRSPEWQIMSASDGTLQLEGRCSGFCPPVISHVVRYRFMTDGVVFSGEPHAFPRTDVLFERVAADAEVFDPVQASFAAEILATSLPEGDFSNNEVAPNPTATARMTWMDVDFDGTLEEVFTIAGWGGALGIELFLQDFSGAGHYAVGSRLSIWVTHILGDVIDGRRTQDGDVGSLLITSYDPQTGRVSGNFSATLFGDTRFLDTITLRAGSFDVPIYASSPATPLVPVTPER